jgi:hypothetical protein
MTRDELQRRHTELGRFLVRVGIAYLADQPSLPPAPADPKLEAAAAGLAALLYEATGGRPLVRPDPDHSQR